jgi:hypothetical protein
MSNSRGDTTIKKMHGQKAEDQKETGRRTLVTRDDGRGDGIRIEMIAGDQRTAR